MATINEITLHDHTPEQRLAHGILTVVAINTKEGASTYSDCGLPDLWRHCHEQTLLITQSQQKENSNA